jgi:hypothetical protein
MSQQVGTSGSALTVVLSVNVALRHTGSLSQGGEVDVTWLNDRTTWCGVHCGSIPQESVKHC